MEMGKGRGEGKGEGMARLEKKGKKGRRMGK